MQFEFKEEDILRLANEIDNRAEYPEIYPDPIPDSEWRRDELFINRSEDLELMVFDFDYSDKNNRIPLFQHERMEKGKVFYTGKVVR